MRVSVAIAGIMLPLAGCGSGASVPLKLSCTTHFMPRANQIVANVTITNTTSAPLTAVVYGPVFVNLRHFSPTPPRITPGQITVELPHSQTTYFGLVVPRVSPDKPSYLTLRFVPPPKPQPVAIADRHTIQASDLHVLDNPDCTIKKP